MRTTAPLFVCLALLLPASAFGYKDGPLNFLTWCGNQGSEAVCQGQSCNNCTMCHFDNAPPTVGGVSVANLPSSYQPGTQYTMAVLLDPGRDFTVGGFELSALVANGLCQGGELAVSEPATFIETDGGTGTQWLKHSDPQPQAGGTALWEFLWTAPPAGTGDVVLSVCSNAANDDGDPTGDFIFCDEFLVSEGTGAVEDCTNGTDDDGDGLADCADPDCDGATCDDGIACTTGDVCGGGVCGGTPDDALCDDGVFCNGAETCDAVAGCSAGTDPCPDAGARCEEASMSCTETVCDDGVDNDGDGPLDCDDADCSGDPACGSTGPVTLRTSRTDAGVDLGWTATAPDGFHVYRGPLASVGAIVTSTGAYTQIDCAATTSALDPTPDFGSEGADFFYLIVPVSGGTEGSYGCIDLDSDAATCDAERTPASPSCN